MLSIARALMLNPRLLLLDEPSEGLAPMIVQEIVKVLGAPQAGGPCHPAGRAEPARPRFAVGDRHHVMNKGEICFTGTSAELEGNDVRAAQLSQRVRSAAYKLGNRCAIVRGVPFDPQRCATVVARSNVRTLQKQTASIREARRLEARSLKLRTSISNVFECRQGSPLLFLHGGERLRRSGSRSSCRSRAKRRLIAPSHPGFGKSSLPEWLDSVDDIAHLYLELLDTLCARGRRPRRLLDRRLDRRRDGDQVAGARSPAGHGRPGRRQGRPAGQARHPRHLRDAAGGRAEAALSRPRPDGARHRQDVRRANWPPCSAPARPWRCWSGSRGCTTRSSSGACIASPLPALFIRGESDGLVSDDYLKAYARLLPNARTLTIPAAGHAPHLEQPEAFASAVLEFLGE